MGDLSLDELENLSTDLGRSTPGSRRIVASPGMAAIVDENISPVKPPSNITPQGVAKAKVAGHPPAHKPNLTQREARSQARINELEETVDELEGKLRAEATGKHELGLQMRKLKVALAEQEQLVTLPSTHSASLPWFQA